MDTIIWLCWTEPTRRATLITCAQLNIFNLLNAPTPVSKLAEATSCSPALLHRLLRQLAATYVLTNPSPDVYGPTKLSIALQEPKPSSALLVFPLHGPVLDKLPAFFKAKGYEDPIDETDGPFQFAHGEGHTFAWLAKTPGMMDQFALHMMGYRDSRPTFLSEGLYPLKDRIIEGAKDKIKGAGDHEEVLFVDVGGGTGPDVQQVFDMFEGEIKDKGRCVLQDQKPMIDIANQVRPKMETQVTDFFKDQPIKGARAYYLHSVLHDWSDKHCATILSHLKAAMTPGYSKLLINDHIVPEQDAPWKIASSDLLMMGLLSAGERTEKHWKNLLESVGMRINAVWQSGGDYESVIEVVRDE